MFAPSPHRVFVAEGQLDGGPFFGGLVHGQGPLQGVAGAMQVEIRQGRLVGIPINSDLVRPLGIIHRWRKRFHRAAQAFLQVLQSTAAPGVV